MAVNNKIIGIIPENVKNPGNMVQGNRIMKFFTILQTFIYIEPQRRGCPAGYVLMPKRRIFLDFYETDRWIRSP
jgi:hypothetical protein